jgi:DNA repair protein RecN (Recombination protein N)
LMLALKAVLARADQTPTLIFDEIDQGIGGRVGAVVGRKLWGLTSGKWSVGSGKTAHQVICITHLPQLAGYGDAHFRVEKGASEGRTLTHVQPLDDQARVQELAQMLGASGQGAVQSAQEIMATVAKEKHAQ